LKTAVVILNWNGQKLLEQFLPSVVLHSKKDAKLYVIDNASTDTSVQFLKEYYPEIKLIQNSSNFGYAKGYNEGLKKVEADLFVLLNSDVEVTENWLNPLKDEFLKNQNLAAAQPKILDFKNKSHFEYAGAAGGFIDKYAYPYCRGRIFNTIEKDNGQYNDSRTIFWASGACLFLRKKSFHKVGGFDEDYFAHQEEIDLCWRLFNIGLESKYISTSKVYHLGGATLKNTNPKKTFLNFRNSLFNLLKNAPQKSVFQVILIRMVLDGIAGIHFLISFKFLHFIAILKAHFSFYIHFKKIIKKRNNTTNYPIYYQSKSIIFLYFVKQLKSFDSIK